MEAKKKRYKASSLNTIDYRELKSKMSKTKERGGWVGIQARVLVEKTKTNRRKDQKVKHQSNIFIMYVTHTC